MNVLGHDASVSRVGVIGLGEMGSRMAHRLIDAGHEVVVWNRTTHKAASLVDRGAVAATSPADVAQRVDLLITMVASPAALSEVTEGPDGFASAAAGPLTVIEMSTVGPTAISRLRSALSADVDLLDAPVLGSTSEVEEGVLAIFVGGDRSVVEKWMPVLSALGKVLHVGPLGAGAAAKLVANSTLLAVLTALGEAVALGDRLGLARETTFEILRETPLGAQAERRQQAIEANEYPHRFSLALAHKDADLVVDTAAAAGIELRVAAAAREWFIEAEAAGLADADYSAVLAHILDSPRPSET